MLPKEPMMSIFEPSEKDKAIDHALWLNFRHRSSKERFGVLTDPDGKWVVCNEAFYLENDLFPQISPLPYHYKDLSYKQLDKIAMDKNPLPHWERIRGLFSGVDGEILRYILETKIPLKRCIRHELASRGFDKNHQWCGFEQSREIWCKETP